MKTVHLSDVHRCMPCTYTHGSQVCIIFGGAQNGSKQRAEQGWGQSGDEKRRGRNLEWEWGRAGVGRGGAERSRTGWGLVAHCCQLQAPCSSPRLPWTPCPSEVRDPGPSYGRDGSENISPNAGGPWPMFRNIGGAQATRAHINLPPMLTACSGA